MSGRASGRKLTINLRDPVQLAMVLVTILALAAMTFVVVVASPEARMLIRSVLGAASLNYVGES